MCHENEMGAAKEQHPYIICRLDKQRRWNSGGTVTRPLFTLFKRSTLMDCHVLGVTLPNTRPRYMAVNAAEHRD